ncbi:MAG: peptidylprolyl isomerase [Proteobacteria bacterium]|nr:peptidylprolyl isomerase [Pseudomonadota bacterium]
MMIKRKGWLEAIVIILALSWSFLPLSAENKELSVNKVAVVNGTEISRSDFDREITGIQQQYSKMKRPINDSQLSKIKKDILERLINHELLYQESQKSGIKVEKAAVDNQFKKFKEQVSKEGGFADWLTQMKLTENEVLSQFEQGLSIQQFIDKQFGEKVTITDEKARLFYDGHPEFFKQPSKIKASHILIKVDPKADETKKAEARKQIEKIQKRLQQGDDFATLAKEFSQCPSSANGGDLGYFNRGQMVKPFEEAASNLKPGELSGIVETTFGYHLIKVYDKKPEAVTAFGDIKDKLKQHLKQKEIEKEVKLYVEDLKKKAKIETFLKENS